MIDYFVDHNCLSDFYSLQRYITELADDKHEITARRWRVYHNYKESFRLFYVRKMTSLPNASLLWQ